MSRSWKQGGCHCGAVSWEADVNDTITADACNCSICAMTGYLHVIIPAAQFRLLKGEDQLTEYTFNTGAAKHLFCKNCGVKSFYVPRSHPDGYSLNLNCMDRAQFAKVEIRKFDGQNWEESAGKLDGFPSDP